MKPQFVIAIFCTVFAVATVPSQSFAQQKTVGACQSEWRANRAANEKAGITQKAYVEKCRAESAAAQPATKPATRSTAKPAATPSRPARAQPQTGQKTVRACQEEWRANRAANEKAGVTQRAYVEKCRGETIAQPAPAPSPAPARPSTRTAAPPAQPAPSARRAEPTTRVPTTTGVGTPEGPRQYASEPQAKARCRGDTVVWVNLESKIYHFPGYSNYGKTKSGAYMCERDSEAAGFRAAQNEKHP